MLARGGRWPTSRATRSTWPPGWAATERHRGARRGGRASTAQVARIVPTVALSEDEIAFLTRNHAAAMITIGKGGFPRPVRVGVALVDGKLWSSGIPARVRTRRLRRDPRCSLFVFEPSGFAYLSLETTVSILDGPDAPTQNLQLFRVMQDRPTGPLGWYGEATVCRPSCNSRRPAVLQNGGPGQVGARFSRVGSRLGDRAGDGSCCH